MEITLDSRVRDLFKAHEDMMRIHTRALACHCECLGMNAENSWAVCNNSAPSYSDAQYIKSMKKWRLINEKGEPII